MFFNNGFADLHSGYSILEDNNFGLDGYPLDFTYGEPSADAAWAGGFDLDGTLAGPSTAEIENWWLEPRPEGDANEHLGNTPLGCSRDEYPGVCGSQTHPTSGADNFNTDGPHFRSQIRCSMLTTVVDGTYGLGALGQQSVCITEYAGPSTPDLSTLPVTLPSTQLPPHFPATFTGPRFTTSPAQTLSWCECLFFPDRDTIAYLHG